MMPPIAIDYKDQDDAANGGGGGGGGGGEKGQKDEKAAPEKEHMSKNKQRPHVAIPAYKRPSRMAYSARGGDDGDDAGGGGGRDDKEDADMDMDTPTTFALWTPPRMTSLFSRQ
jgi:hypothetical protein